MLGMAQTYESITDAMKIMKTEKNAKHLKTMEKYYILKFSRNRFHMTDAQPNIRNVARIKHQVSTHTQYK
jgi:hypothetical protein